MERGLKEAFLERWARYFGAAELPVAFEYAADTRGLDPLPAPGGHRCLIALLARVRRGAPLCLAPESVGCRGGMRYMGFTRTPFPGYAPFLSHDDAGGGERYLRTPALAEATMGSLPVLPMRGERLIFKRWDTLTEEDRPDGLFFIAQPDVLSALVTLARFDTARPDAVIAPFGAGCTSLVYSPYREQVEGTGRAVLGMTDPSARRFIKGSELSIAFSFDRFRALIPLMDECFLTTPTWEAIRHRPL